MIKRMKKKDLICMAINYSNSLILFILISLQMPLKRIKAITKKWQGWHDKEDEEKGFDLYGNKLQ
jgi:hypothetical protein